MTNKNEETKPLISIIVPVYNVENYIEQCIESILHQNLKAFELILVNDGSKDKSGKICDQYSKKDNRIHVIHKQNEGVSAARNAGLDIAQGDYIAFVDGDDYIDSDMYELLYNLMTKQDADIVACRLKGIYDDHVVIKDDSRQIKVFDKLDAMDDLYGEGLLRVVVWNKLYKRSIFDNLRFDVGAYCEDVRITYKALMQAEKIVYIAASIYNYRIRNDSQTRKNFNLNKLDILDALLEQIKFYEKYDLLKYANIVKCQYYLLVTNYYFILRKHRYHQEAKNLEEIILRNYHEIKEHPILKNKMFKFKVFKLNRNLFMLFWELYLRLTKNYDSLNA